MANPAHVEIVKQGAKAIEEWRKSHPLIQLKLGKADLREADLAGADLREADLGEADFGGANLEGANLGGADLPGAGLRGANLGGANLVGALLADADLRKADLRGVFLRRAYLTGGNLGGGNLGGGNLGGANLWNADLREANFEGADLRGTDVAVAIAHNTIFANVDLSSANGLETVLHDGPSTVGVDTLYKSKGKIPESFLRGCGVPDNLITYLPSLLNDPIQFYSCFISYSHKDEGFCKRLHARMQAEHLRVWYAPEDMKAGRKIHEQIDEAIRLHDKLLLVLSETSMNSEWVKTEIYHARQREAKEGKQVLFPVRLVPFDRIENWKAFDADTGKDTAREIREYFIPDFSNWKDHDAFEAAFKRLLEDLKKAME